MSPLASDKPRIGLVAGTSDEPDLTVCRGSLTEALLQAGALPIILPHAPPEDAGAYLDACDGLLLPGGGDFSPAFFGGAQSDPRLRRIDPRRDAFEFALAREADRRAVPVLGICKGMQWMAVVRGGTLHIDIGDALPNALEHSGGRLPSDARMHDVTLASGSRLAALAGTDRLAVNSRHHQAVADPGRSASAAVADDGVIEAIEWSDAPFAIGVQWHPEDLAAGGDVLSRRLFSSLVEAASDFRRRGGRRGLSPG